jgi:hypothetical protein
VRPIAGRGIAGSGSAGISSGNCAWAAFFGVAPLTVTNDGQKPFTQEKSLLQLD